MMIVPLRIPIRTSIQSTQSIQLPAVSYWSRYCTVRGVTGTGTTAAFLRTSLGAWGSRGIGKAVVIKPPSRHPASFLVWRLGLFFDDSSRAFRRLATGAIMDEGEPEGRRSTT